MTGSGLFRVRVVEPGCTPIGGVYGSRELALAGASDFRAASPEATVFLSPLADPSAVERLAGPSRCSGCAGHVDVSGCCDLCHGPGAAFSTEYPRTLIARTASEPNGSLR